MDCTIKLLQALVLQRATNSVTDSAAFLLGDLRETMQLSEIGKWSINDLEESWNAFCIQQTTTLQLAVPVEQVHDCLVTISRDVTSELTWLTGCYLRAAVADKSEAIHHCRHVDSQARGNHTAEYGRREDQSYRSDAHTALQSLLRWHDSASSLVESLDGRSVCLSPQLLQCIGSGGETVVLAVHA